MIYSLYVMTGVLTHGLEWARLMLTASFCLPLVLPVFLLSRARRPFSPEVVKATAYAFPYLLPPTIMASGPVPLVVLPLAAGLSVAAASLWFRELGRIRCEGAVAWGAIAGYVLAVLVAVSLGTTNEGMAGAFG